MNSKKLHRTLNIIWFVMIIILIAAFIFVAKWGKARLEKENVITDRNEDAKLIDVTMDYNEPIFYVVSPSQVKEYAGVTIFCIYNDGKKSVDYFASKSMEDFSEANKDSNEIRIVLKDAYEESVKSNMSEVFASKEMSMEECREMYEKQKEINSFDMEKEINMTKEKSTQIFLYGNVKMENDLNRICYLYNTGSEEGIIKSQTGKEIAEWILENL